MTAETKALEPCPHCGEANELYQCLHDFGGGKPYAIDCLGCGAEWRPRDDIDVIVAWNTRQAAARLDAGVTREQGWRDISTAPKDGTPVLVWYPLGGFHGVVARFPKGGRYWQVTWDCDDLAPVSPTHWMPLPPLPHNPKEESR